MRHQVFGRKLNRDVKERKALFKSLIRALIDRGRIKTTVAKAKAIAPLTEKLVSRAKKGTTAAVLQVTSFLTHKESINRFLNEIVPQFKDKTSGFIRMRRVGKRSGDNAEETILEWAIEKSLPHKQEEQAKMVKPKVTEQKKIQKKS